MAVNAPIHCSQHVKTNLQMDDEMSFMIKKNILCWYNCVITAKILM